MVRCHKGRLQTTGGLIFSIPLHTRTALYVCVLRGHSRGRPLLCSPRISNPSQRGRALASFYDWRGERKPSKTGGMCQHQAWSLTGTSFSARQGAEGWAQDKSLVREARMGTAHTPAWDPCIPPSPPMTAAHRSLLQYSSLPRPAWDLSEPFHPHPLPVSATRTQQIPLGLRGVRGLRVTDCNGVG